MFNLTYYSIGGLYRNMQKRRVPHAPLSFIYPCYPIDSSGLSSSAAAVVVARVGLARVVLVSAEKEQE
jgi:hypothetical protein